MNGQGKPISDIISYIYPMANSLKGGAVDSEYNVRNLFGCLLSKSSARTNEDFKDLMERDNSWYSITESNGSYEITVNLQFAKGVGNCNGYYLEIEEDIEETFTFIVYPVEGVTKYKNDVYIRINYSGTGISDGCYLWLGSEQDAQVELENMLNDKVYDIGIKLGTIEVDTETLVLGQPAVTYKYNDNITACIDMDRIGSTKGSFEDLLYFKLRRLYELMIDNGVLSVGNHSNDDSEPYRDNDDNVNWTKLDKVRFDIRINKDTTVSSTNKYVGGLYLADYRQSKDVSQVGDPLPVFTFTFTSNDNTVSNGDLSISMFDMLIRQPEYNASYDRVDVPTITLSSERIDHLLAKDVRVWCSSENPLGAGGLKFYSSQYFDSETFVDEKAVVCVMQDGSTSVLYFYVNGSGEVRTNIIRANKVFGAVWQ